MFQQSKCFFFFTQQQRWLHVFVYKRDFLGCHKLWIIWFHFGLSARERPPASLWNTHYMRVRSCMSILSLHSHYLREPRWRKWPRDKYSVFARRDGENSFFCNSKAFRVLCAHLAGCATIGRKHSSACLPVWISHWSLHYSQLIFSWKYLCIRNAQVRWCKIITGFSLYRPTSIDSVEHRKNWAGWHSTTAW